MRYFLPLLLLGCGDSGDDTGDPGPVCDIETGNITLCGFDGTEPEPSTRFLLTDADGNESRYESDSGSHCATLELDPGEYTVMAYTNQGCESVLRGFTIAPCDEQSQDMEMGCP